MLSVSCVSRVFASVHCCLVVTCWERADLLALVTFPCGILGQVWYLIVSFPDLCLLSYFVQPSPASRPRMPFLHMYVGTFHWPKGI